LRTSPVPSGDLDFADVIDGFSRIGNPYIDDDVIVNSCAIRREIRGDNRRVHTDEISRRRCDIDRSRPVILSIVLSIIGGDWRIGIVIDRLPKLSVDANISPDNRRYADRSIRTQFRKQRHLIYLGVEF